MSDNVNKTGKADNIRINVNQSHELEYWTGKFKTTPGQLKAAVKKVGPLVANVQKELKVTAAPKKAPVKKNK